MERIVEWGLIIWEKETRPSIQVISTSISKSDTYKHSVSSGTLDLLFMLCCPKQLLIKGNIFRLARVAGIRLRQLLTGSNEFRVGALDYDYKPDFSEFINSSTEDTSPLPAHQGVAPFLKDRAGVSRQSLLIPSTPRKQGMEIWLSLQRPYLILFSSIMVPGTQALPVVQWAEVSRTCVDLSTDFNI